MTATQEHAAHRDWRSTVEEGDTVGIARRLAADSTGTVVRSASTTVRVHDHATDHLYHFRRLTGVAVDNCTVFLVPPEIVEEQADAIPAV